MEVDPETVRALRERISQLEKENQKLRNNQVSEEYTVIDELHSIGNDELSDQLNSEGEDNLNDETQSDVEFNEQRYADWLLKCIDNKIQMHENNIRLTKENDYACEPHLGYKSINAYNELRKGLLFKLRREEDKLHTLDEQLKELNKFISVAPSGANVLTHTQFDENSYDRLMDKRLTIHENIQSIQRRVNSINNDLLGNYISDGFRMGKHDEMGMSPANFFTLQTNDQKIKENENQITQLLKEKRQIISELQSKTLINRVISDVEQLHKDILNKEEQIKRYKERWVYNDGLNRPDYEATIELENAKKEFTAYGENILSYLQFVPKQWFKDKFAMYVKFYKDMINTSDFELYRQLNNTKCKGRFNTTWLAEQKCLKWMDNNGMITQVDLYGVNEKSLLNVTIRVYRDFCCNMCSAYAEFIRLIDNFDPSNENDINEFW